MTSPHVLVIDDDRTGLEVLQELLALLGATTTMVQDTAHLGPAIARLVRLDLVFMDLEMPRADGFQVLAALREQFGITAPIVAYSVHTNQIDTAQKHGFDGFVSKPVDWDRFPAQFERLLAGLPVWDAT